MGEFFLLLGDGQATGTETEEGLLLRVVEDV